MFSSSMTFHVQSIYILRFNVDIGSLVLFCTYESYECKKNLLTRYIYIYIFYVSILIFYAQDVIPADFKQLFAYIVFITLYKCDLSIILLKHEYLVTNN